MPDSNHLKVLPAPSRLSRIQIQATKMAAATLETPPQIAYQHTVLCQTSMPYRDPGPDVRVWDRRQGNVSLRINAGEVENPETEEWVPLGLPFGPKPRLILAHLNTEALKTGSPEIDVETSLTAFVRCIQKRPPTGPEIHAFKEQLSRLATATIRMAMTTEDRVFQMNNQIVSAFEMLIKDERQRVLWSSVLHLSQDYFLSLQKHAVPLDELALGGLAHSTMALDIYAWLAQRLHRVPRGKPQFIAWAALKDQFGAGLDRMIDFKRYFRIALGKVLAFYPRAKVAGDGRGLTLRNSPPPIAKKHFPVHNPTE